MNKISARAVDLIAEFEGFRSKPYQDKAGYMTIGYGHKIVKGELFTSLTQEQAFALLQSDIGIRQPIIDNHVMVTLSQNQTDAFASILYNIGAGAPGEKDGIIWLKNGNHSHLLIYINQCNFEAAADEFLKWDHVDGEVCDGLLQRREKERELFLTPA